MKQNRNIQFMISRIIVIISDRIFRLEIFILLCMQRHFFDGMKAEGQENIINLLRCAWAGSQKYGALVWSGDIKSSFPSMKNQVAAGLNMGNCRYSVVDNRYRRIFCGANINDPEFHELLVRWFEYGCFCPVMRLHGISLAASASVWYNWWSYMCIRSTK